MQPDVDALLSRITVEGSRATIKFKGTVTENSNQIWLGVEWDDPSRGKHSGENNNTQFFQITIPGAGSFLKQTSKLIQRPKDFVSVLKEKYVSSTSDSEIQFGGDTSLNVETVGWDKITKAQGRLDRLRDVGLMEMDVGGCFLAGSIRETCSNINDLDLSKNLLSSWIDVAFITIELPCLESLRLNHNLFQEFTAFPLHLSDAFKSLKILSLNFTKITWKTITLLEPFLPVLTELHVRSNDIRLLNEIPNGFKNLILLNLEDNIISTYDQIATLSKYPNLSTLILAGNQLDSISPVTPSELPSLKYLNLNRNALKDWTSINNLNTYPTLTEIRIKENPIINSIKEPEIRHFHLIARLAKVSILDGSEISVKRRRDAEIYYLNECVKIKHGMNIGIFSKMHPRYMHFCDVYGEPELCLKNFEMNTVKDGLIGLIFEYEGVVIEKGLPKITKIRALKSILKRLFKIKSMGVSLSVEMNGGVTLLNDDIKELNYYDIEEGAKITVGLD